MCFIKNISWHVLCLEAKLCHDYIRNCYNSEHCPDVPQACNDNLTNDDINAREWTGKYF